MVPGRTAAAAAPWRPHNMRRSAQHGLVGRPRAGRPTAELSAVAHSLGTLAAVAGTGWLTANSAHVGPGWDCLPACSSRRPSVVPALPTVLLPRSPNLAMHPIFPARQGLSRLPSAPFDPSPSAVAPPRGRAAPMRGWTASAAPGAAWGWSSSTLSSIAVPEAAVAEPAPGILE